MHFFWGALCSSTRSSDSGLKPRFELDSATLCTTSYHSKIKTGNKIILVSSVYPLANQYSPKSSFRCPWYPGSAVKFWTSNEHIFESHVLLDCKNFSKKSQFQPGGTKTPISSVRRCSRESLVIRLRSQKSSRKSKSIATKCQYSRMTLRVI